MLDPDQLDFLALALTVARRTDPSATTDASTFELHLAAGTFRLHRLHANLADAPREVREQELRQLFHNLDQDTRPPASRDEVLASVIPRVSDVGRIVADAIRGGWDPTDRAVPPPFADLGGGVGLDLIARKGVALHMLTSRLLRSLGVSPDEAFQEAMQAHPTRRQPEFPAYESTIPALALEDGSAVMRLDVDAGNQGTGLIAILGDPEAHQGRVWMLRSQDDLLAAPEDDREAVEALITMGEAALDDPRRVTPIPLTTVPVEDDAGHVRWVFLEWNPESDDDPLTKRVVALNRRHRLERWEGTVRPALDEVERARNGPNARYIGNIGTITDPRDVDLFATWTTWSMVGGLIPTSTTYVAIQHPDSTQVSLVHRDHVDEALDAASADLGPFALYDVLEGGLPESHQHVLDKAIHTFEAGTEPTDPN